jgi:hypothetical protein
MSENFQPWQEEHNSAKFAGKSYFPTYTDPYARLRGFVNDKG